jgi:hypothetical protein
LWLSNTNVTMKLNFEVVTKDFKGHSLYSLVGFLQKYRERILIFNSYKCLDIWNAGGL